MEDRFGNALLGKTGNVEEIDRIVREAWDDIVRTDRPAEEGGQPEPDTDTFFASFGRFIERHPILSASRLILASHVDRGLITGLAHLGVLPLVYSHLAVLPLRV